MRKQRVVLEEVAHFAGLGREVQPRGAVEEGALAQLDAPGLRAQEARDGPEGEALPGAGGARQHQRPG